jgi:hypothetical protein
MTTTNSITVQGWNFTIRVRTVDGRDLEGVYFATSRNEAITAAIKRATVIGFEVARLEVAAQEFALDTRYAAPAAKPTAYADACGKFLAKLDDRAEQRAAAKLDRCATAFVAAKQEGHAATIAERRADYERAAAEAGIKLPPTKADCDARRAARFSKGGR